MTPITMTPVSVTPATTTAKSTGQPSTEPQAYSATAKLLHWLMAFAIVFSFLLGLSVDAFPRAFENTVVQVHMIVGMAILALVVVRIANRMLFGAPDPVPGTGALMSKATVAGHLALYALMLAVPVTGLALTFLRGRGIDFGLFEIVSPLAANRTLARPAKEIHEIVAWGLVLLAAGHAAIALIHHRVFRDDTLRRMMPGA